MKKLANRIVLITLLPMMGTLLVFTLLSWNSAKTAIWSLSDSLIQESVYSWTQEFEAFFDQKEVVLDMTKAYIEDSLTLKELADAQLLGKEMEEFERVFTPVVKRLNLLNIYAWYAPEYTSKDLMEISIRNMKLDGSITTVKDQTYTREDLNTPGWAWFTVPEKKGWDITDPYEWEGYDQLLISYCKSIVIGGKTVGVLGSDMFIGALNDQLLAETFMEKGHYALLNSNLEFLAHPTRQGDLWQDVMPEEAAKTTAHTHRYNPSTGDFHRGETDHRIREDGPRLDSPGRARYG